MCAKKRGDTILIRALKACPERSEGRRLGEGVALKMSE